VSNLPLPPETPAAMAMHLKLSFLVCLPLFWFCADLCLGARRLHVESSEVNAHLPLPESPCIDCAIALQLHGEQSDGNAHPPLPEPESFHNADTYTSVSEPARMSPYYPVSEPALPDQLRPEVAQTGKWFAVPGFPILTPGFPFPSFLPPLPGTAKLGSDQP